MKNRKLFLSVVCSLFALSALLTSCNDVNWFANFMDEMESLKISFTFFSSDELDALNFQKNYKIGKTISSAQLINDSSDFILKNTETNGNNHAKVIALKVKDGTSAAGVDFDAESYVTQVNVTEPVSFVPVIGYKVLIYHWIPDLGSSNYSLKMSSTWYGQNGANLPINDYKYPSGMENTLKGFEYSNCDPGSPIAKNDEIVNVDFYYSRKDIKMTFNPNGGTISDFSEITKPYETLTEGLIPTPNRNGYEFTGWSPQVPDKFPDEDTTYNAQWTGQEYNITYKDGNLLTGSSTGKEFTGIIADLPTTYVHDVSCDIPNPSSSVSSDILFEGWYKDPDCNTPLENEDKKYYISDLSIGDITLYAKWKPRCVYVNPTGSGLDTNSGFTSSSPLKTLEAAKALMYDNRNGEEIRVMSTLNTADITQLSETWGNDCSYGSGGIKIIAQSYPLIDYTANAIFTLSNVHIDGDANFTDINDIENTNDNNSPKNSPLIKVTGSKFILGSGCTIKNCDYSGTGALIKAEELTVNCATISYCRARNGSNKAPICALSGTSTTLTFSTGTIELCDAIAIYINGEQKSFIEYGTINKCSEGIVFDNLIHFNGTYSFLVDTSITECTGSPLRLMGNDTNNSRVIINNGNDISNNTKPVLVGNNCDLQIESKVQDNGENNIVLEYSSSTVSLYQNVSIDKIHFKASGAKILLLNNLNTSETVELTFDNISSFIDSTILEDGSDHEPAPVASNKSHFSVPSGYEIDNDGKLVVKTDGSNITFDPQDPVNNITEYSLGEFEGSGVKITNGTGTIKYKVTEEVYQYIPDWGSGARYVLYTVEINSAVLTYKALVDPNTYEANIVIGKGTICNDYNSTGAAIDNFGIKNVYVYVNVADDYKDSVMIKGTEGMILVYGE